MWSVDYIFFENILFILGIYRAFHVVLKCVGNFGYVYEVACNLRDKLSTGTNLNRRLRKSIRNSECSIMCWETLSETLPL